MVDADQHLQQNQEDHDLPPVIWLTPEEERQMFDEAARQWLGISGEEFVQRWQAGEYADIPDDLEHRRYIELNLMIPLARGELTAVIPSRQHVSGVAGEEVAPMSSASRRTEITTEDEEITGDDYVIGAEEG